MKILFTILLMIFVEIFTFIKVGGLIGAMTTISITILSAIIGVSLVKSAASKEQMKAIHKIQEGEAPVKETLSGLCLLFAGVLLLLPGLVSDFLGAILLIPFARHLLIKQTLRNFSNMKKTSTKSEFVNIQIRGKKFRHRHDDKTIDGIVKEVHNDR